jgi:AMP nucleosidase
MIPEGVKTEASDKTVTTSYVDLHLTIGIESLLEIKQTGKSVKHLRFQ